MYLDKEDDQSIKELKKLDWLAADYSVIDFIESNGVAKYLD